MGVILVVGFLWLAKGQDVVVRGGVLDVAENVVGKRFSRGGVVEKVGLPNTTLTLWLYWLLLTWGFVGASVWVDKICWLLHCGLL